jgi:hypothetical protein
MDPSTKLAVLVMGLFLFTLNLSFGIFFGLQNKKLGFKFFGRVQQWYLVFSSVWLVVIMYCVFS